MRRTGLERRWNVARKQAQGERFLRMAGVSDLVAAAGLWEDPNAPGHRRCLAVRAVGLLGEPYPKQLAELADDDESALARAWRRANYDAERRRLAERRIRDEEEAIAKMGALGVGSPTEVMVLLQNPSETPDRRESAADVLGGLRCRDAVGPLIEALAEGEQKFSWICMWAITRIGSRRGARRLMDIVRGNYALPAWEHILAASNAESDR